MTRAERITPGWDQNCLKCAQPFGFIRKKKVTCVSGKHAFRKSSHLDTQPEMLVRIQEMLDDGCSHKEIAASTGVSSKAIGKHFPGTGWTNAQSGQFGMLIRYSG